MSYTVKPIDDQTLFDAFLKKPELKPHLTFMHTWEWGDVMQKESSDFVRFGVYDETNLVAIGHAAKKKLRLGGTFWYAPRGLALDYTDLAMVEKSYTAVRDYFKTKGGAFFRFEPDLVIHDPAEKVIDSLGTKRAPMFTQAQRVWCVDIQKDEASQLAWMKDHGMRSNVPRYLRKATRAGVTVRSSDKTEDLELFIAMLERLRERKHMSGAHDDHLRLQFGLLAPKGYEKIFLAEKDGKVLASTLMSIYGREASYLHGASSDEERDLSAPHTLHVETMKWCMENRPEVERYNFWGIVGSKNRKPSHPRNGYSEFKRSFGGYKEMYIRGRDFVYKPFYWRIDWLLQKYWAWKFKND